jgi:MFS family permease
MTWTNENAHANVMRFRAYIFLKNLDFTRGIFVVFLLAQGLSNAHIGVLQAILFWTIFVCEIPTGVFADRTRRKVSTILGTLLLVATFASFPFAHEFSTYVLVFVLWGLALALCSGATSALLYDGLKGAGPVWLKTHVSELGRLRAMSTLCMAASMAAAGFFYGVNSDVVFFLTAATASLSAAVLAFVDESPRESADSGKRLSNITSTLYAFAKSKTGKNLLVLMLSLSLLEAVHTPIFIMSQSLLKDMGLTPAQLTAVLAVNFLVSAAGMYYAPHLSIRNLRSPVVGTIGAAMALLVLVYVSTNLLVVIAALILLNLIPNILFVYTDHYFQENSETSIRASWGSVQSFVTALSVGLSFILVGVTADAIGIRAAFLIYIGVLAVSAVLACAHSWTAIAHEAAEAA